MVVPFLQTSTFSGLISTKDYGTSQDWEAAATFVKDNSASWSATSGVDIPAITHYLSTNNIVIGSTNILGNIVGEGSLISFNNSQATGPYSFTTNSAYATGDSSFAANDGQAFSEHSAAFNNGIAAGMYSLATGYQTYASSNYSFAGGNSTAVSGVGGFAIGNAAQAHGDYSHAEGSFTLATGESSHAEGGSTVASGDSSHAEGGGTNAQGDFSHAEGYQTVSSNTASHAEGSNTIAFGDGSHAEGYLTEAKGLISHAAGCATTAAQDYTYIWSDANEGTFTRNISTTRTGQYMVSASGGVFLPGNVGIGTDSIGNALTVVGVISATGIVYASGGDSNLWNSASSLGLNASINYVHTNFVPTSGGSVTGNFSVGNNLTVLGNLTALGTTTFASTINSTTSALSVYNTGPGPALYVYQGPGNYDVASFYDGDGIEVLHVGNANPGGLGYVGVNESNPTQELTVRGNISATQVIYDFTGNSNQWNSTYTYVTSNSGNIILNGGNTKNSNLLIGTNDTFNLNLETNNTTRVTIVSTGSVGVGTTLPNEVLTVIGSISSTNIVYAQDGNSNTWNTTNTLIQSNSSIWNEAYQVSTNLQSNSATIFNTGNFILETNASPQSISYTYLPNIFKKVSTRNITYLNLTGGLVTQNYITGNAFQGDSLLWSGNIPNILGASSALAASITQQASGTDASRYHINYNDLHYFYGSIAFSNFVYNLTAIRFPDLKVCDNVQINGCTDLFDLNFNNLEYIGGYGFFGTAYQYYSQSTSSVMSDYLTDINLPKLKYVGQNLTIGGYGFGREPVLSGINLNNLEYVYGSGITIGNTPGWQLASCNFSQLKQLEFPNLISSSSINLINIINLKTLIFPKLKKMSGSNTATSTFVNYCSSLQSVSFPELEYSIGGYIFGGPLQTSSLTLALTSVSVPKLKVWTGSYGGQFSSTVGLVSVELGTNTLQRVDGPFTCSQRLTQQSVDNILKAFARLDGTNNTVKYTNTLTLAGSNSAPSYTGGVTTTSPGTNFTRTGFVVTANVTNHGHTTDDIITFTGNGQSTFNGTYTVRVSSANQFEYTVLNSGSVTGSGITTMRRTVFATDGFRYYQNIALRGTTVTINLP